MTERSKAKEEQEEEPKKEDDRESQKTTDASDRAVETLKEAVNAQQDALLAQQKAVATASEAFLAQQEASKQEAKEEHVRQVEAAGSSRRNFLKIGGVVLVGAAAGVVVGAAEASAITVPFASSDISSLQTQASTALSAANQRISSLQSQANQLQVQNQSLQAEVDTYTGVLYLSVDDLSLLEAVAETVIPSDSNGPGAKEAGVVYFIDRQLGSDYGSSGTMYMKDPFVLPSVQGPITVNGVTYPEGTPPFGVYSGAGYQYRMDMRYFWKWGLDALQNYSNSTYGGNFETLTNAHQTQALTDLWNNKPTTFNDIVPSDFAYELFMMIWSGYLTDPMYGGNRNMVGWTYTGFTGLNQGNFYGEGYTQPELMVAKTPTRLKPASLGQFQKGSP